MSQLSIRVEKDIQLLAAAVLGKDMLQVWCRLANVQQGD